MDAMEERNVLPLPGLEHRFSNWSHWTPEVTLGQSTCLIEDRNAVKDSNYDDDDDEVDDLS
jgi:hypothetical protein